MRSDPTMYVRLPADLRDWLRARAAENARSLTGELTWLLQQRRKADDTATKEQRQ